MANNMVKREDFLENEVIDLSEELALVSPTATPLTTLLYGMKKRVKALDVAVTWRERELNSNRGVTVKGANSELITKAGALEGADAGAPIFSSRKTFTNFCQILEKVTQVSGTAQAVHAIGMEDPFDAEIADRLLEMKRDMEWYFINGTLAEEDDTTPRQMNGIINLINADNVFTLDHPTITEDDFLDALQSMWERGSQGYYHCFVCPTIKRAINKMALNAHNVRIVQTMGLDKTFGFAVDEYESDFGTIKLVLSGAVPANMALILNLEDVEIAELRPTFYEALEIAKDAKLGHVINESTIKLLNSYAGAKIILPNS